MSERFRCDVRLSFPMVCGGRLVLRNGRYGQFYGCSNYPKCNYILNR